MKKQLISICLILSFGKICFSQQKTPPLNYNVQKVNTPASESKIEVASNGDTVLVSKYSYVDVSTNSRQVSEKTYKGTPFFRNGWYAGTLYFEDGSTINGTLAYNLTNGVIYYSLGSSTEASEAKPIGFTLGENTFSKLNEKYNKAVSGYFELIFGGPKLDLFRQYNCVYHGKNTGELTGYESGGSTYEGSYDKGSKLYLGWNNTVIELKTNNNIYKQFGEYRGAMEKFGKENKLNFKKENDMISLVVNFSNILDEFEK